MSAAVRSAFLMIEPSLNQRVSFMDKLVVSVVLGSGGFILVVMAL
jgi:hypothetical protein